MRRSVAALASALLLLPATGFAQSAPGMISAADPDGMAQALSGAGYAVTTDIDSYGDPLIITDFNGYEGRIVFYGCDETTHDDCDSVQFTVGLDRSEPMSPAMVNDLVTNERFISINLDEEGDPWITWDVVTLDGIPSGVFLFGLRQYSSQVQEVAQKVFEAEP